MNISSDEERENEGEIEQERTGGMVEVECIQVNWLITCNVVTSLECRITIYTNRFHRRVVSRRVYRNTCDKRGAN